MTALLWSAGAVLIGWLGVAVVVVAAWATAIQVSFNSLIATVGQAWLLAHGLPAQLGEVTITITPLGLTAVLMALNALAASQTAAGCRSRNPSWSPWLALGVVVAMSTAGYVVFAGLLSLTAGTTEQTMGLLGRAAVIAVLGALPGALRGLGFAPLANAPRWAQRLPLAIRMGVLVLALGSLAAAVTALISHWPAVSALHEGLQPDTWGTVLLIIVQLAWAPNLLAWAGSYALGAGTTLGVNTLVAPNVATVGLLPALPVFGAVPTVGAQSDWVWVIVGVAAGLVVGLVQVGAPPKTWVLTPVCTGGAGLAVWGLWVAFSAVSGGNLGTDLMTGFGPRFPQLTEWTLLLVAVPALFVGVVFTIARRDDPVTAPPTPHEDAGPDQVTEDDTQSIG